LDEHGERAIVLGVDDACAIRELVADCVATRAAAGSDLKRLLELSEVIGLVSHFPNDVFLVHVQKKRYRQLPRGSKSRERIDVHRGAAAVVVVTDITHERQLAGDLAATVRQNLYLHGALAESERRLEDLIDNLLRPQSGSRAPNAEQLDALTRREREVLGLLGKGKSTDEMARELQLSAGTVRLHVKHVLAKLGVSSRPQAALRAQELARQMS
jgi:ATP/maltotriose-dependent transcriptional regulator MalT